MRTSPSITTGGVKRHKDYFEELNSRVPQSTVSCTTPKSLKKQRLSNHKIVDKTTKQEDENHMSDDTNVVNQHHSIDESTATLEILNTAVLDGTTEEDLDTVHLLNTVTESPTYSVAPTIRQLSPAKLYPSLSLSRDDSFIRSTSSLVSRRRMSGGSADSDSECRSSIASDITNVSLPPCREIIRRETSKLYMEKMKIVKKKANTLFESLSIVSLVPLANATNEEKSACRVNEENRADIKYIPTCHTVIPQQYKDSPHIFTLAPLCMPDFMHKTTSIDNDRQVVEFSLVLTDEDGQRKFGHCLKFVPKNTLQPLVICLLSPQSLPQLYGGLLVEFRAFIDKNGYACEQFEQLVIDTISMAPPMLEKLNRFYSTVSTDSTLVSMCQRLGVEVVFSIVDAILNDSRVIISAPSISLCTKVVQTLISLLYPFNYPHSLLLLLPSTFVELCHAPTPYFFGILRCDLNGVREMLTADAQPSNSNEEPVLIVDVDYGILRAGDVKCQNVGDQRRFVKAVKHEVENERDISALTVRLHQLFALRHLMLISHYRDHIFSSKLPEFDEKSFISSHPSRSSRTVLSRLVTTSIWQVWLEEQKNEDTRSSKVHVYCRRVRERAFGNRLPVNLVKLANFVFE